ncbi:hypothetical protein ACFDR9_000015 [Janthinobacterium sp. CG_23.3]|uniref:hypothetical protein n=1 Tax=Janthinobacterium sp. CG_23.3 TaxID=3349634 RepID=UPI0038D3D309
MAHAHPGRHADPQAGRAARPRAAGAGEKGQAARGAVQTLALEAGYQTGEKPVTAELVETVLLRQLDNLEPTLARHGYRLKDMTEQFDAWICPDVYLINRIRRMLGNVLDEVGFSPKDRVRLTIEDDLITLTHERSGLPASSGSRSAQN